LGGGVAGGIRNFGICNVFLFTLQKLGLEKQFCYNMMSPRTVGFIFYAIKTMLGFQIKCSIIAKM
jgi:hypothetical protein